MTPPLPSSHAWPIAQATTSNPMLALTALASAISSATDASSLIRAVCQQAHPLVEYDRISLAIKTSDEHSYRWWQADRQLGTVLAPEHTYDLHAMIHGWVLQHGKPCFTPDVMFDGNPTRTPLQPTGTARGGLALPLSHGSDVFGVLCFEAAEGQNLAENALAAATLIALQMGTAARNVQLAGELGIADDLIFTLATAIEAKDPYTQGHCNRVATYATMVGERFGMSQNELRLLHKGAFLHDIGKIGVRDAVLLKEGSLGDDEYSHIKEHPAIGARILNNLPAASAIVPTILYHHERWDGTGYPTGLVGVETPLSARIVSVVDAFDAMTTTRCYRPAFDVEKALTILAAGAGSQWDPDIVEHFIAAVRENP